MKNSLDQALAAATATLCAAGAERDAARVDARVLLTTLLDRGRAWLMAHGDEHLPPGEQQRYDDWIARRAAGEPVAYILGKREFWSLDLRVTPHTLIPRPDTETLVAAALERWPSRRHARAVDLGTGSGAIALALASEHPEARVLGVDNSDQALAVARANGRQLGIDNIEWRTGAWFAALRPGETFDLIVSNPPYIAPGDHHLDQGDVAFEPRRALVADDTGYADLLHIIKGATGRLSADGWLLVEHGNEQHERVGVAFTDAGFCAVETLRDLAGHPRVTLGRVV